VRLREDEGQFLLRHWFPFDLYEILRFSATPRKLIILGLVFFLPLYRLVIPFAGILLVA
jgi:hypothetical protein